ncbi:uncharacterized protein PSFLO_07121 [Pseudozyma flocculosa]|uniref:Uncharacterized protein n=1 Tax=Pseudozyma flocculosa TaxID=84751 RepID=A0A5C3FE63_9BASI|nr:uncharacterized protein PSFLO_07121 [Pseudozyma flocculosa]
MAFRRMHAEPPTWRPAWLLSAAPLALSLSLSPILSLPLVCRRRRLLSPSAVPSQSRRGSHRIASAPRLRCSLLCLQQPSVPLPWDLTRSRAKPAPSAPAALGADSCPLFPAPSASFPPPGSSPSRFVQRSGCSGLSSLLHRPRYARRGHRFRRSSLAHCWQSRPTAAPSGLPIEPALLARSLWPSLAQHDTAVAHRAALIPG